MTQDLRPEQRIAAAQRAMPTSDNQGRPTTAPTRYEYGPDGRLIRAAPASQQDDRDKDATGAET